jgi:hypothetical protein
MGKSHRQEVLLEDYQVTLPNDVARCLGVGSEKDGEMYWREGCDTCQRRTSPAGPTTPWMEPPLIIAFWCVGLIEP